MKILKIANEKCTGCGICLTYSQYFCETENGKAQVKNGNSIQSKDEGQIQEVVELCPENAIDFQNVKLKALTNTQKQSLVNNLITNLKAVRVAAPTYSDLKFDKEKYKFAEYIDAEWLHGDYEYNYKSSSSAQDAGWSEFNRKFYSRREQFIMEILSQYGTDKIYPYYDLSAQGVYAKWNKQFEEVLNNFIEEISIYEDIKPLSADFTSFQIYPSVNGDDYKRNNPITRAAGIAEKMSDDKYRNENYYRDYIDTGSIEEEKEGRFFSRTVTRYCYEYNYKICQEFKSDMLTMIAFYDLDEEFIHTLKRIVEGYSQKVEKEIKKKVDQALKALAIEGYKYSTGTGPSVCLPSFLKDILAQYNR